MKKYPTLTAAAVNLTCALGTALPAQAVTEPASQALTGMINLAAAKGDSDFLTKTLLLALDTEPQAAEALVRRAIIESPANESAILTVLAESRPDLASTIVLPGGLSVADRQAELAALEAAKPKPGFFDAEGWTGEASLGGSLVAGNTEEKAVAASLVMTRAVGAWEHNFTVLGDYSVNNDVTTQERVNLNYGAKWFLWERGYLFGLLDFEYDGFTAFDWRLSEAIGFGYRVLDGDTMTLDLEGGPGSRQTRFSAGGTETEFIFVLGSDFDWQMRENLKFTSDTDVFIGSERTTLRNLSAFTAKLTDSLSGRLSYQVIYNSNVPVGQLKTDTIARVSLVYGF